MNVRRTKRTALRRFFQHGVVVSLLFWPGLSFSESVEDLKLEIEDLTDTVQEIQDANDRALTASGYVDVEYKTSDDKNEEFRMHHFSLFFTKRFTDDIKFFSEIEFEDTPKFEGKNKGAGELKDAEGKIFLEAVNFDYLYKQQLNFRLGRYFSPAGIWSEDHYPPYVSTQERPMHIRKVFPQLTDGAAVYGTLQISEASFFQYTAFFGNGESKVSGKKDLNSSKALGIKTEFLLPVGDEFKVGVTYYTDGKDTANGDADKLAMGMHAKLRFGGLTFQTEWASAELEFEDSTLDYDRDGLYFQTSYRMRKWTVGHRYDVYDETDSDDEEVTRNSLFVNYNAYTNVVLKGEYHSDEHDDDTIDDVDFFIFTVAAYFGQ